MIAERTTNFVYFSSLIEERPELRSLWRDLEKIINGAGIEYGFIKHTNDLWCRDYIPVQIAKNRFVQFTFNPSYYHYKKWRHLLTYTEKIEVDAVPCTAVTLSPLLLDGGNLIRSEKTVILTERVFKENKEPREQIVQHIKQAFQVDCLHLLPSLPNEYGCWTTVHYLWLTSTHKAPLGGPGMNELSKLQD